MEDLELLTEQLDTAINGIGAAEKENAIKKIKRTFQRLADTTLTPAQRVLEQLRESDRISDKERQSSENGSLGNERVEYYVKRQVYGQSNETLIVLDKDNSNEKVKTGIKNFKDDRLTLSMVANAISVQLGVAAASGTALTDAELASLEYKWCNHTTSISGEILATELTLRLNDADVFTAPLSAWLSNEPFVFSQAEHAQGGLDVANRPITPNDKVQFVLSVPSGTTSWGALNRFALRVGLKGYGFTYRAKAVMANRA